MPNVLRPGAALGAVCLGDGHTRFRVWAPQAEQIELRLLTPEERTLSMARQHGGYWQTIVAGVEPGSLYVYRIDGDKERPDPASRFQPDGVHGPSMVVSSSFAWEDQGWQGIALEQLIIYELHVGTFTPEGTFDAILPYLSGLKELGITAIEIMPVAQFPGPRNWGYDGVGVFAVQNSYGGPEGLARLVNACHKEGLAVILDVVYNHLGAEGNYLWDYGPYFTDRYKTPWGSAVNFDGAYSDDVRRYFIENALYWLIDFHIDGLRLDAVHAILDFSARPFVDDLAAAIDRQQACLDRKIHLIAESDLNDRRVVSPRETGGYGLDAQWSDDFHHAVHTLLTGEGQGYYQDFAQANGQPLLQYLVKALREGFVYSGEYSRYRQRRHGNSAQEIPAFRFVVCIQNHDQIGNRMMGDRLSTLVSFARLKLGAGILLLSPFIPMLFMGEEYGETNPFQYFVSHTDPALIEAIRKGRQEEFAGLLWEGEPPDPAAEETFLRSKLCRQDAMLDSHSILRELYGELIQLRKTVPALKLLSKAHLEVLGLEREKVLYLRRWAGAGEGGTPESGQSQIFAAFNFGDEVANVQLPVLAGRWRRRLDSAAEHWRSDNEGELLSPPLSAAVASGPRHWAAEAGARPRLSQAPESLVSNGSAHLTLSPTSFALYILEDQS